MRRRDFITRLGGAATWVSLPLAARAQQAAMPLVAVVNSGTEAANARNIVALRQGLKEAGFVQDQTIAMRLYWADEKRDQLPALLARAITDKPAVIVSNSLAAHDAKAATTTIPIVFTSGSDPVRDGLVTSLNRPGGNITGIVFINGALGSKRLELIRQLAPKVTTIAALVNPHTPETDSEIRDVEAAAQTMGQDLVVLNVASTGDIETAFSTMGARGVGALICGAGPFMFNNREQIVALAARHRIAAMYAAHEAVTGGGLACYDASISDAFRQAGLYAGRVLKGEKPADLPVQQSIKFEFVINLKTARALGLDVSPALLALADEVIE
jgi:putative tryptophan/tyrosine transport system substrate-binding protein